MPADKKKLVHPQFIIFLVTLISSFSVELKALESFYQDQWKKLNPHYLVELPSDRIAIDPIDRHFLSANYDPQKRNHYINKTYQLIGKELAQCLGVEGQIGNWYYFASWASVSAGEIISGNKFHALSLWQAFWVDVLQFVKLIKQKEELVDIFANVNLQIALEMIPLGRDFLQSFCGQTKVPWDDYEKKLLHNKPEHQILIKALKAYYDAIEQKEEDKKVELITLASTLQVISEQMRVDSPLKKVFSSHTGPQIINSIIQSQCTKIGSYEMKKDQSSVSIFLGQNINKSNIHPALETIELDELKELYKQQGLINPGGQMFLEQTACQNWGDLNQRKKFLSAMFWSYINNETLFGNPQQEFSHLQTLKQWDEFNFKMIQKVGL